MSVPEGLRHTGRMEVHVKAQALASYTAKIISNENNFDPEIDDEIIKRIKNCAYDIYTKSWSANGIHAESNEVNRRMRYELQEEAITKCRELMALIGIAKQIFHISSKRMKYWSEKIMEVQALIQAWKESDIKRYGKV